MPRDKLRIGRFSEVNQIYSVTTVTHLRRRLFTDDHCVQILLREMRQLEQDEYVNTHAWVVMPDHLYWLFQLCGDLSLSEVMKRVKARSANSINKYLGSGEGIWQRAFYDHALRKEEDLIEAAKYIIATPLRAGLVMHLDDYPYWGVSWIDRRNSMSI